MQYLDVLGVDCFVPRWVLPGAKPSTQAQLPVALKSVAPVSASTAVTESIVAVAVPEPQGAPVHVGSIIEELTGNPAHTEKAVKPTEEQKPDESVEAQAAVQFSLSIWRVSDRLLILDSRLPKEALPTQALLNNIVKAKGWQLSSTKPEVLNWPMFSGFNQGGGWTEASELVSAFLHARLDHQPAKYLWLMGSSAYASVVAQPNAYQNALGHSTDNTELGSLMVVLPSLADMLKNPELKRLTWEAIRDLS